MIDKEAMVKKANEAIQLGNRLSLDARKIFNVFLYHAYPQLLKVDVHKLKQDDLCELIGCDTRNRQALTRVFKELMNTIIEVVRFEGTKDEEWTGSVLVGSAKIKKGTCEFSFPGHLKLLLNHPDFYTRFYLEVQRRLSSYHSLALYELCKRFEKVMSTGWIDVDTWKKLLGVEKLINYRIFHRFSTKVIKPAVKQINQYSDIIITPEYKRSSHRVVAIRFLIKKNPQFSLFIQPPPAEIENLVEAERDRRYQEVTSKLDSKQRTLLEEIFEHDIVPKSPTLRSMFADYGYESYAVQIAFQEFVIEQTKNL